MSLLSMRLDHLPPDVAARVRMGDPSLRLFRTADHCCMAELTEEGTLRFLAEIERSLWWSTPVPHPTSQNDIAVTRATASNWRWEPGEQPGWWP